jgi:hypothetical protein
MGAERGAQIALGGDQWGKKMKEIVQIVQRLGHVLYWAGCAIAAVILLVAIIGGSIGTFNILVHGGIYGDSVTPVIGGAASLAGLAFLIWLVGRTCRYILAGT